MTPPMLAVFVGAAAVADRMPAPPDRYRRLADHADVGLGADEYRGPRRFTRPSEAEDKKAPVRSYRQAPRTGTSNRSTSMENR